jgi:hypothetical protein
MTTKKIKPLILQSDEAVVGIVVTVLVVGLIVSATIMINVVYVPQWLENSEASHMKDVSNQFTQLKYALDLQTLINDSTAMTTFVTLGTEDIPFFDVGRTFDTLEIIKDAVIIDFTPGGSYTSDIIVYTSGNSYYVDQSFIYEAGALIINQENKSVLFGTPPIVVTEYGKNITFYITEIDGYEGKSYASGRGTYPIFTKAGNTPNDILINNVTQISITTSYPNAWNTVVQQTMEEPGFDYNLTKTDTEIIITFNVVDNNFYIRNREISTQIAFGLIE